MKVLVTGGGGFLGRAIVEQLLEAGYEVASYSRGKYDQLEKMGVSHHRGSLTDFAKLKSALGDCEAVIHTASRVGMWGPYQAFYESNVTGTAQVIRACRELGIRYLVFTSSPSVVYSGHTEGGDERLPYPEKFDAYYPQTKALAEQAVLQANGPALTTCALRPHLVWGPRDPHFLPRLYERRKKGLLRLPGGGEYLVDTIYVDNAARAHLQALEVMQQNPAIVGGKAYFLSQGEPITIRNFIDGLLASGGLPPVDKTISPQLARLAGRLLEGLYRSLRLKAEPPITLFMAKQLSSSHWYDISAARRDLGYRPEISIEEGWERLKLHLSTTVGP